MRLILGLLWITCVSKLVYGLSISDKTLNELQRLIKLYEDAKEHSSKPVDHKVEAISLIHKQQIKGISKAGLKIIERAHAKTCGIASRLAYGTCFTKASDSNDQGLCAKLFVQQYTRCYFGNTHEINNFRDLMQCTGSCTWNFDNCLMNSSNVEIHICMSGRNNCYNSCPWNTVVNNAKRETNCHSECEGDFDLCYNGIQLPTDVITCSINRNDCKGACYIMEYLQQKRN